MDQQAGVDLLAPLRRLTGSVPAPTQEWDDALLQLWMGPFSDRNTTRIGPVFPRRQLCFHGRVAPCLKKWRGFLGGSDHSRHCPRRGVDHSLGATDSSLQPGGTLRGSKWKVVVGCSVLGGEAGGSTCSSFDGFNELRPDLGLFRCGGPGSESRFQRGIPFGNPERGTDRVHPDR